jgi:Alkylmercury lyase
MDPRGAERCGQVTAQRDLRKGEGELPELAAAALALAEIPASKMGPARRARLTESERELYFWILRYFRTKGRPSHAEVHEAAHRLGIDAKEGLETLAREDLVHRGPDAEVAVAYPFSGRPTAHRVRFAGGREVDAMCAIDALGIAPMFGEQIEVASRDPVSGDEIRARVAPGGAVEWRPRSAVVVAGVLDRQSDSCRGCCPVLNFFVSPSSAERWLAEHPQVRGNVISMEEAAAAGQAVFGEVLRQS